MPENAHLRVRIPRSYWAPFSADLGQQKTTFISRPWTPLKRLGSESLGGFAILPEPDFDAIHAFNAVPVLTRRPYVVTFEDHLPRVWDDSRLRRLAGPLRRQMLKPRCIALLAMSDYAVRQFRVQNHGVPELEGLEAKLEVLRPAIAPTRTQPKPHSQDKLRLVFVGRHFYRKGGPALVRAHGQLREAGIPVETAVVSSLIWSPDDYVGPASAIYVEGERARLSEPGITHYSSLPNDRVLQLIAEADYLVLPTLHDTFGFVSLEALAAGTPVIATDTCAQSEIVEHGESGYFLPLESDGVVGKWPWLERRFEPAYQGAYEDAINSLAASLTAVLSESWEKQADYEAMSAAALRRVTERFNRDTARERLEELYDRMRLYRSGR